MAKEDFQPVCTITDTDKIIQIPITCREFADGDRRFSCAFQRAFVQNGEVKYTFWLQRQHLLKIRGMIDQVLDRIDVEETKAGIANARASRREV